MSSQCKICETSNVLGDLVHTLVLLHALLPTKHIHLAANDIRVEVGDWVCLDKLFVVMEKGRQKVQIVPLFRSHV